MGDKVSSQLVNGLTTSRSSISKITSIMRPRIIVDTTISKARKQVSFKATSNRFDPYRPCSSLHYPAHYPSPPPDFK
ncbi:hypothetical protein K469DRAFT_718775 [Zopfia rhizophila CBS 207.26]|uniref:Uncharacterized protein n=1 Tax=Zopfia rhizophila CBS 207.26 TaxID=1314779 RepID=A0A6A6DRK0_9PEZI|nr:hypothetical protein K469DRAFT_714110 [Zopfia rhizophila CBS 207.26]KAF2191753.1 hypothetical protein K469DRAFT_718775 [Zopfia rhizophila CBS 207.26]